MISLASEDVPASQEHYARAYEAARNLPDIFSDRQIVNFGQRHAFSLLRLGQGSEAEHASGRWWRGWFVSLGPIIPTATSRRRLTEGRIKA